MATVQPTSVLLASTSMKINAAKARLRRNHQINNIKRIWDTFLHVIFRVQGDPKSNNDSNDDDNSRNRVVQQLRAITWPEITSLVRTGLSGYWSLAIFLIVGHAAAHITGPSIVVSVIIAAVTSMLSGLCLAEFLTRPQVCSNTTSFSKNPSRNNNSSLWKNHLESRNEELTITRPNLTQLDSLEVEVDQDTNDEKHLVSVVYASLGELPAFLFGWMEILINVTSVSACSRAITSTVDKTTDNRLHDLVLDKFGMTPYINTYPDFLAGALVMSFALLVAAGLDRSKTLQRWINCLTCSALVVVILIGAWDAKIETYKEQAFLFNGSHGVILSSAVLSVVFGGNYEVGRLSQSSAQPHRLIPTANGLTQLIMTISMFVIALIMPFVSKLSNMSMIAEVPLLQIFDSEIGDITWIKLLIAVLSVLCLCSALLEISIMLHKTVNILSRNGLIPQWLSKKYYRTDTPFFGCAFIGAITAVLATLGDTTRLLVISATAKVSLDLMICCAALSTRYGLGALPSCSTDNFEEELYKRNSGCNRRYPYQKSNSRVKRKPERSNRSLRTKRYQHISDIPSSTSSKNLGSSNASAFKGENVSGYSKLANYHLGGSGFQVKSRTHQSSQKRNQQFNRKKIHENNLRGKRNTKHLKVCKNDLQQGKSNFNVRSKSVSEGLYMIPKSIFKKFFDDPAKTDKYGQLPSANNSITHGPHGNEGTSQISVLDENKTNVAAKERDGHVDIDFAHTRESLPASNFLSEDDECHSDCKTESSLPPSGYGTNECDDSLSDTFTDSDIKDEGTSDTNEDTDTEEEVQNKHGKVENLREDKTDDDTDIEAAVFEYHNKRSDPHSTISTVKGTHNMLKNGLSQQCLSTAGAVSSSASTDNDISGISPTNEDDGMPLSYILDNNFSSVQSFRYQNNAKIDRYHEANPGNKIPKATKLFDSNHHRRRCKKEPENHKSLLSSPTQKSVKKVVFLQVCLIVSFFLQNVILSNLKNTSIVKSPMQMIALNLVVCLVIFGILLAINKQPQQTYSDNPIKSSLLENNKCKTCMDSRLFCTSLFCCCYCCFNFSEEDDIHSTNAKIAHNFRKTFLIPITPWIHAIIIFLNVSLLKSVLEITWPEFLSWMTFGLVVYFLYGITHSSASNDKRIRVYDQRNTKHSNSLRTKNPDEFREECLVLSRRQDSLHAISNVETLDNAIEENKKYDSTSNTSRTIIKNYNPNQNQLSSEVIQDI